MAEIAKSKSLTTQGRPVSVTVHSVGSMKPGADTTGFGRDIELVKIGKPGKEPTGKKSDGQRKEDKSESAKMLDHVVESSKAKKMGTAAAGDFDTKADKAPKEDPDSMTDMAQGRSFKPRLSGAQQRKKAKEKSDE